MSFPRVFVTCIERTEPGLRADKDNHRFCKSYMVEGGGNQAKLDEEEDEGTTTTRMGENSELFR